MARISTYGIDAKPELSDKVIGTDTAPGADLRTKNYSLREIIDLFNQSNALGVADQSIFLFQNDISLGRESGTISFVAGGGEGTPFSSITQILISKTAPGNKSVAQYLPLFVGKDIILAEAGDINKFGTYKVTSITTDVTEPNFFLVTLENYASNGVIAIDGYYIFSEFANPASGGTVTSVAATHGGDAFTASIGNINTVNPSVDITMNGSSAEYIDGAGNLQTFPTIPQGDITDVNGGTYITTVNPTGPVVTVNHDLTSRTDTASATTPSPGDTITAVDSVTTNATGHVEAINLKSVTLPIISDAESAEKVIQTVRFGEAVSKGDPLVITGYHGSNGPAIVERADATDDTKMPAYGVALEDYANNATGLMIAVGDFDHFDTSSYSVGDTLYVAVGGGMTNVKPTGTALIQNMGIVSRSNANNGDVEIVAIGRTNDVPNLPTGRLFVGTAANTSLASDVVYVDDANDRVGIGTTSPGSKLEVQGGDIEVDDSASGLILKSPDGTRYRITVANGGTLTVTAV